MRKIVKTLKKYVCRPIHLNPIAESMYLCTYVLSLCIDARDEKICKCLILVLCLCKEVYQYEKEYVKSVQQITTNFSQFMSTKAND